MADERIISVRQERRDVAETGEPKPEQAWTERRTHCWGIQNCDPQNRDDCYA